MASQDIGLDLGTATVIVYDRERGVLLREPSVVGINQRTREVICVGDEAYEMIGRTPDKIRAVMPMADGVISDFDLTGAMVRGFLRKVYARNLIKPRLIVCVPSGITDVESRAVVSAALGAGSRKVYLIEEPVAAALGAGFDLSRPHGHLIIDIGGGTTDIAVLSLNGIVCKKSIRVAGRRLDQDIARHIKNVYGLQIGERTAENLKKTTGSVSFQPDEDVEMEIKGLNTQTGLPGRITIGRKEVKDAIFDSVMLIVEAVKQVLEMTPPELAGDIYTDGMILSGGGAFIHGLDRLLLAETGLATQRVEDPDLVVARGTAIAFDYLDKIGRAHV